MRWDDGLWAGVYKEVEVQKVKSVNGNTKKFFVCKRKEKSWNIEPMKIKSPHFLI